MNKKYLGIGLVVLVFASAGLYFVANNESTNQDQNIINSATSTLATSTEVVFTEIEEDRNELDLTKLIGKNRLYTAEEGRYENLSEEEQAVLIEAYHCRDYKNDGKQACKHHAEIYGVQIEDRSTCGFT